MRNHKSPMHVVRIAALAGSALGALLGTPGLAQTATPPATPPATPAAEASQGGIAEIIVTASRRKENLQKESRDITAVVAADLTREGVTDPTSLQKLAPGLTLARAGSQLQVSVRGVGDRSITLDTDPAIAFNVDGVYYPKSFEASASLYDLERVEVLKGPQGTLYGRNASAGAINLIVAKPKFENSGFGEVEVGNYNDYRGTAALNFKVSSVVAVRLSGQVVSRDGYLTDGYNDDKEQAVRAQVLYAPTDTDTVLLSGTYSHLGGKGDASVIAKRFDGSATSSPVADPANPWAGPTDPATLARFAATNPQAYPRILGNGFQDVNVYTVSANIEHRMGWATLTVLPSYVGSTISNLNYASIAVPIFLKSKSSQFAFETRLSSAGAGAIKWVIGAFGSAENVDDQSQAWVPYVAGPPGTPSQAFDNFTNSPKRDDRTAAGFGEINATVAPHLRLIAGLRYTWERKTTVGFNASQFAPLPQFPLVPSDAVYPTSGLPTSGQITNTALNYRVGAEYDLSRTSMAYATVASGFKAGGFYDVPSPGNSYRPEHLTAYSLGSKNRFLDNRLQVNVEAFYWNYTDKQETFVTSSVIDNEPITFLETANAGKVTMYGADLSIVGQITPMDRLSFEAEYLHSKYDTFLYTYGVSQSNPVDPTVNCPTTVASGVATVNCSGNTLVRAPKYSGRVGYAHTQSLGSLGELSLNGGMNFSSSYFLSNNFTALSKANSYQIYDASLSWTSPDKRFSVTGFIKNIGNTAVYTGGTQSTSLSDAVIAEIAPPRTYGVRLRAAF